jgi:hypothetical protein
MCLPHLCPDDYARREMRICTIYLLEMSDYLLEMSELFEPWFAIGNEKPIR